MAQTALVGPAIEAGRDFLELLDRSGVPIVAALWNWSNLKEEWDLDLATPWVEQYGLKETYRRIRDILSKTKPRPAVDLLSVQIFTPESSFIKCLRRELRRARDLEVKNRPLGDGGVITNGYIYVVR